MPTEPPTSGHFDETVETPVAPVPEQAPGESSTGHQPTYGTSSPTYGTRSPSNGSDQPSYGTSSPWGESEQPSYGSSSPWEESEPASYGAPPAFGPPVGTPYGGSGYPAPPSPPATGTAAPTTGWWSAPAPAPTGPGYGTPTGAGYGAPTGPGYGAPAAPGVTPPHGAPGASSFLSKLFDLSFTTFVTPSIVKVVYVLAMVVIGFGWLLYSAAAFDASTELGLLVLVVVGPLAGLASLVAVRVSLELYLAVVRLAEDVHELRQGRPERSSD